jgi:CheY-like chemotaxis protein
VDGADAVRKFREYPGYEMIFMDIHMPEVDGYEATRQIRALGSPQAVKVPIVAMTANVFKEDVEHCLEAGMNDHIGKPVEFEAILSKMNKYIAKQRKKI